MQTIVDHEKTQGCRETNRTNYLLPQTIKRKNLYYSAVAANLLYVSLGCAVAWPSSAIPILIKNGIKTDQLTWMVSLLMLGSCFGPTVYSCSIDRFGRKYSLILTGIIYLLSWTVLGISDNIYCLYIGRFVSGLAVGSTFNCVSVYVSEISDVDMRQTLTSLTEFFISLGCLIVYAIGPRLTYGNLVLVSAIPNLAFGLAISRIPESPYHLVSNGKTQQALETLIWLRGPCQRVTEELTQIECFIRESELETKRWSLLSERDARKALVISSLMFFILPFAAADVFVSYLGPVFQSTTLAISPEIATIIVGSIEVIFGALEPIAVHKFGSKWTMIICSSFCSCFLLCFGIYKYFDERHYDVTSFTMVPVACLVLYEIFFVLGVGAVSWSISVELFPPKLKGLGMNIVTTMNWMVDFLVVSFYGDLSPIVGVWSCFVGFSLILGVGTILQAIIVPNTKGIPLYIINNQLQT